MQANVTELHSWHQIDWKSTEASVKNLRQRIYVASRNNDLKKAKSLQRLMLRSRANMLISIRRATQINKGRRTPGVDREVVTTPEERLELFGWMQMVNLNGWQPGPTRRVEIPKGDGKKRPLGIPNLRDRCLQTLVKNALEPFWEARFEGTSYGFRPGRSTHDAIEEIWLSLSKRTKEWILDADIKGAFDNIDHEFLMDEIGPFPARKLIEKWLKAGYMKDLDLTPTIAGTPQGGIISPLLANIALHGMEEAVGVTRKRDGESWVVTSPCKVIKYADDFVVLTETREQAHKAKEAIEEWLTNRGLEMSEEKTAITHIRNGFDFLGFTIRLMKNYTSRKGESVLVVPSKKNQEKFKNKLREIFKRGLHKSPYVLILELNPLILGWGMYFRTGVAKNTFSKMDKFIWHRTWRYALKRHPNKGKRYLKEKYYTTRGRRSWVFFGEENGQEIELRAMMKISIKRHIKVKMDASPDDPTLTRYWEKRQKQHHRVTGVKAQLWKKQNGICPRCNGWLNESDEEINKHHINGDRNNNRLSNLILLHETCHNQYTYMSA